MNEDSENTVKRVSRLKSSIYGIVALCIILLFIVFAAFGVYALFFRKPPKPEYPEPPDLSKCTHIEIKYRSIFKVLSYDIHKTQYQPEFNSTDVLSYEEQEYLKSLQPITVKNPEVIKLLQQDVNNTRFCPVPEINLQMAVYNRRIVCFNNEKRLASLCFKDLYMETDEQRCYKLVQTSPGYLVGGYSWRSSDDISSSFPTWGWIYLHDYIPELKPFSKRIRCAISLLEIMRCFKYYIKNGDNYSTANRWCDDFIKITQKVETGPLKPLICPSAGKGKCHYAMNPNCGPNSPGDMVLLFETKDGWNQHGGPELFTFDNHEPKGGCVLLNDGTVKFIRTEEELNALCWK